VVRENKWQAEKRIDRYSKYILDVTAFDDRINFSYPDGMMSLDAKGDFEWQSQVNEYDRRGSYPIISLLCIGKIGMESISYLLKEERDMFFLVNKIPFTIISVLPHWDLYIAGFL